MEANQLDPGRKLNDNECAAIAKVWDDFFLGPNYDPMAHKLYEVPAASPTPATTARTG